MKTIDAYQHFWYYNTAKHLFLQIGYIYPYFGTYRSANSPKLRSFVPSTAPRCL